MPSDIPGAHFTSVIIMLVAHSN